MDQHDELFTPDTVDEQIDWLLSRSPQQPGELPIAHDLRLVHDLQHTQSEDAQRLQRIRERLAQRVEARVDSRSELRLPAAQQSRSSSSQHIPRQATSSQAPIVVQPVHVSHRPRRTMLFSSLLAAVVIIGMVLTLLTIFRPNVAQPRPIATPVLRGAPGGYYGSNDHQLYRADAKTGRMLWHFDYSYVLDGYASPPIVDQGTVYSTYYDTLYAVNAVDGALRWSYIARKAFPGRLPLVVADGQVYIATDTAVLSLRSSDGKPGRSYPFTLEYGNFAVMDDVIYTHDLNTLTAINIGDGHKLWGTTFGGYSLQGLVAADGLLCLQLIHGSDSTDGNTNSYTLLSVLAAQNGRPLWASPISTNGLYAFTMTKHVIYYGEINNTLLRAYDVNTHKELWQRDLGLPLLYTLHVDSQVAAFYVGHLNTTDFPTINGIVLLDIRTGALKGSYPQKLMTSAKSGNLYGSINLQSGQLYVQMRNDEQSSFDLYAFDYNAHLLWKSAAFEDLEANPPG